MLVSLTMALQLPVWGFSFQARGYEMLALVSWSGFISLLKFFNSPGKKWLYIHVASCAIGYFCVPSFLYFHAALLAFALAYQVINKKVHLAYWKYQLSVVVIVYLLYLPCLCFSGMKAVTSNAYVVQYENYKLLAADIIPMFRNYMDYCFASFITHNHQADLLLFLLPLCLLFYRKNRTAFFLGVFYAALWGSLVLLVLKMKLFPIDRTLPGHFSITLALMIYTAYLLVSSLAEKVKIKLLPLLVIPLFLVMLSVN